MERKEEEEVLKLKLQDIRMKIDILENTLLWIENPPLKMENMSRFMVDLLPRYKAELARFVKQANEILQQLEMECELHRT
jgi:hypothetical protein